MSNLNPCNADMCLPGVKSAGRQVDTDPSQEEWLLVMCILCTAAADPIEIRQHYKQHSLLELLSEALG